MAERRREQGSVAERHAESFLCRQGFAIVDRNARTRWGELDLVARDRDELVFVEVKSRREDSETHAVESITSTKLARLIRLGQAYVQNLGDPEPAWRIDVVTVVVGADGSAREITHIRHAVEH